MAGNVAPAPFNNTTRNWLTYESIFNEPKWSHTDEVRPMGVYSVEVTDNLRIAISSKVVADSAKLEGLRAIFFPSLTIDQLKSLLYEPWKGFDVNYDANWKAKVTKVVTSINQDIIKKNEEAKKKNDEATKNNLVPREKIIEQPPRARLPYNVVNNSINSVSIGTWHSNSIGDSTFKDKVRIEPDVWPMWQTASRSCVVRPPLPAPPVQLPPTMQGPWSTFGGTDKMWNYFSRVDNAKSARLTPSDSAFNITNIKECYSVKTGIMFVGTTPQGGSVSGAVDKATLEADAILAAVRTDYMNAMNGILDARNASDPRISSARNQLLILPEILTVTCIDSSVPQEVNDNVFVETPVKNDGFQLRDLTQLDSTKVYFPALSVPWVRGFDNITTLAHHTSLSTTDFDLWSAHWSERYAARLGKTKALLHLLYGFASLSPNAQNFVFELDPADTRTVTRTILRDVLDYRIHTSWVRLTLRKAELCELSLDRPLCDDKSLGEKEIGFVVDPSLPGTVAINNMFVYQATTLPPPKSPLPVDPKITLLSVSETGPCAPLTPADITAAAAGTKYKAKPGEVMPGPTIQFHSGLQLNFFAFSALYSGNAWARDPSTMPADAAKWKRVYKSMLDWGISHAWAFVKTVNDTLSEPGKTPIALKSGTLPITEAFLHALRVPVPNIYIKEKPDISPTAATFTIDELKARVDTSIAQDLEDIHKKLLVWDFFVSNIIENAIYKDPTVFRALRKLVRG